MLVDLPAVVGDDRVLGCVRSGGPFVCVGFVEPVETEFMD